MLEGYQEYDSIIGNGASYLDLPVNLTGSTKIVCEFTCNNKNAGGVSGRLFGNVNERIREGAVFGHESRIWISYASFPDFIYTVQTGKHSICLDGNNLYYDFTHIKTWDYVEFQHTTPLRLMGYYNEVGYAGNSMLFHWFKIAEDSTSDWLYDLVPAKRLSDGVGGWHNKVDDTFYPSSSNVDFTLGNPIFNMNNIKKLELRSPDAHDLPDGYTQVDYLESTGTQYIDTGVIPNQDTGIKIDATITTIPSPSKRLFGALSSNIGFTHMYSTDDADVPYFGLNYTILRFFRKELMKKYFFEFNFKNSKYFEYKGVIKWDFPKSWIVDITILNSIFLFGANQNGSLIQPSWCRIHQCFISQDQDIIQHLIPAIRNEDNKPGMYDLVSNQFLTNKGTGEFVIGNPVINKNLKRLAKEDGTVIWEA